jgi:hypothetical protein
MTNTVNDISLPRAALIAGLAYLMMMVTPFAEFYIFPKLIVTGNFEETTRNIMANEALFRFGIVGYLINFLGDLIAAWALYILLRPVNAGLSLLTALFRLVYTFIGLAALLNLVTILRLLNSAGHPAIFQTDQLYAQVQLCLASFRTSWSFGYIFFGIHLWLLGYLVYRSKYIPRIVGVLLIIAGSGWLVDNLKPFLFPGFTINFTIIIIAGLGELAFMFWLLIRGPKMKESI